MKMKLSYLSAILLLATIKLIFIVISLFPGRNPDFTPVLAQNNSEALLAQGKKLKLSEVDLYDLELIPGVSDRLGLSILEKRSQIISCNADRNKKTKCPENPLELVHGIASKKAQALQMYLELD